MSRGEPVGSGRPVAIIAAIVASFAAVAALRFAVDDPSAVVGFLYGVPISLAAARFGWAGALASAAVATALMAAWAVVEHVPASTMVVRMGTFAAVALVIGFQVHKSRRLELERAHLLEELRRLAMLDQLTGVANRRSWDERFAIELRQAARGRHDLVLVAVDLDGLKRVNDTRGHEGGDRLIRGVAAVLSDGVRETDFVARVGGDEFLLLLPRCTADDAARLVGGMAAGTAPGHEFSAGIAAWDGTESGRDLIARADRALYRAKAAGGARAELALSAAPRAT